MLSQLRTALMAFLVFAVLTGLVYPLAVTVACFGLFTDESTGSMIKLNGSVAGSELIGQPFDDPKYFWGRPSATSPAPCNATPSSGSNLSVGNLAQLELIANRSKKLREADPENRQAIPVDLITASGSGLDPHISPAAAHCQCERIACVRKMDPYRIHQLVDLHIESRQFGVLGQPRVNVLKLNLALDNPENHQLSPSWKDPM